MLCTSSNALLEASKLKKVSSTGDFTQYHRGNRQLHHGPSKDQTNPGGQSSAFMWDIHALEAAKKSISSPYNQLPPTESVAPQNSTKMSNPKAIFNPHNPDHHETLQALQSTSNHVNKVLKQAKQAENGRESLNPFQPGPRTGKLPELATSTAFLAPYGCFGHEQWHSMSRNIHLESPGVSFA